MARKSLASVAVIMGSDSDWPVMKEAVAALKYFGASCHCEVVSAHRTPQELQEFATAAQDNGLKVIIAGAGGAAHLPGMVAAFTHLPVIGVPVPNGHLNGLDALYSIVQMPKGVPVATVAIGQAWNAGVLAAQMLSVADKTLVEKLRIYKGELRNQVKKMKLG